MMSRLVKTLLGMSALSAVGPLYADTPVTIAISNVSESDTQIFLTVFSGKKSWLKEPYLIDSVDLSTEDESGAASIEIALPPGEYAFQIFHDLDGNGEMKTNFIGIPKEPVGVSNDAKGKFGPPKYKNAKIEIGEEPVVIPIALNEI